MKNLLYLFIVIILGILFEKSIFIFGFIPTIIICCILSYIYENTYNN